MHDALPPLESDELEALRGAAAWYASYHAGTIAAEAQDGSAYAVVERERYLALISALRKLGLSLPLPEALCGPAPQLA